jgi:hypothetical protein
MAGEGSEPSNLLSSNAQMDEIEGIKLIISSAGAHRWNVCKNCLMKCLCWIQHSNHIYSSLLSHEHDILTGRDCKKGIPAQ